MTTEDYTDCRTYLLTQLTIARLDAWQDRVNILMEQLCDLNEL